MIAERGADKILRAHGAIQLIRGKFNKNNKYVWLMIDYIIASLGYNLGFSVFQKYICFVPISFESKIIHRRVHVPFKVARIS